MTPQSHEFEIIWSGALERSGQALGLSAPILPSIAAECMRRAQGRVARDLPGRPEGAKHVSGRCRRCLRKRHDLSISRRLCAYCVAFEATR